jgi:CheY-like chemotaxis protein
MKAQNDFPTCPVIFIVEDEELLRFYAAKAFKKAGFIVIEAKNVDDALTVLTTNSIVVHAIFTDINTPPGMNGLFLAAQAREYWPWIRLAVTSGEVRPSLTQLPASVRFFPKPYDIAGVIDHFLQEALVAA